jgi:hypothetical protein
VDFTPDLIRRTTRFENWIFGAVAHALNAPVRRAYERIQERYYALTSNHYKNWNESKFADLEASTALIGWLSLQSRRGPPSQQEIGGFYLSLFMRPEFDSAIAELGRAFESRRTFADQEDLWSDLGTLQPALSEADGPGPEMLLDLARHRSRVVEQALNRMSSKAKTLILPIAVAHLNDRTTEVLSKLSEFPWFSEASPEDQRLAVFVINLAAYTAENAHQNIIQSEVLTAAIDIVLEGNLPIKFSDLGEKINGEAHTDFIVLSNRWANSDPSFFISSRGEYLALDTFPHEVAHILSGARVEESAQYFEEEYRAWMVGYVGRYGEVARKSAAIERIAYLISPNGIYKAIHRAWKRDPRSFFRYFKEFGFKTPDELIELNDIQLLDMVHANRDWWDEAPQWGWEGFLTLKRPPKDWKPQN